MYDINDTVNVIIKIANNNDTFINQFDMQYLLLILHKTYEKIYNEYLFENTSTAKSEREPEVIGLRFSLVPAPSSLIAVS